MRHSYRHFLVMGPLIALAASYPFLGIGLLSYPFIGLVCMATALVGVFRYVPVRRTGWMLVLGGFSGWVAGDFVYLLEQQVLHLAAYPAFSDVVYVVSYVALGAGLLIIARHRGERSDVATLLDAAILAAGTAVVLGVFVIAPISGDSSLTLLGKLTVSLYPIADVVLLGIVARLWAAPGARTPAFRLLAGALSVTLVADLAYNVSYIAGVTIVSTSYYDVLWLASYVLVAGAVWAPSAGELTEPAPRRDHLADPSKRLVVLTGGLLLPAVTLFVDGLSGSGVHWEVVATGSVLLALLVLARMAGLLTVVRTQAVQLAALARSDPLTGIPNRRTWDYELSRACQQAREHLSPLTVALLDLDHFKDYNDAYGHPAGDLLLREAAAAWTDLLRDGEVLARYGGEEFAVLFPGLTAAEAKARVHALLERTPGGQTFSAGVATWDPATEPGTALAAADVALYEAKRAGRDRVLTAAAPSGGSRLPTPTIVFQPIVDLTTTMPVAFEALSRFAQGEPLTVFSDAWRNGAGPELEAEAISAALARRPPGIPLAVNVSIAALGAPEVLEALSGDLTDVILEVTEHHATASPIPLGDVVDSYRERGAVIAVDDMGSGFSNLDRVLLLRPDIVKLDMSIVHGMGSEYHAAVIRSASAWAENVGARICAEGVETEEQWHELRALGVHWGQGYFFGRPRAATTIPVLLATQPS